ncbi:cytochrome P450 [Leucobacter chromiireducens]|uniref:cytochrome P450 n=1 Tax=Leucobacter chromiireducens TaxID=283877 RepID=UPI003F80970D
MTGTDAPVADWVTIPELYEDPFPIYARLRAEGGVHWVPSVGRYLVTSYEAVHETELDQEVFSANEEGSLQIRAMGHSMLRRDDPEHYVERKAWQPALRPGAVKRVWTQVFRDNAAAQLERFREIGPGADLVWDFAAPYAAENLRQLAGLYNVDQADLQRWSQTMIDATGNYSDDPEVWRKGEESFAEVDVALDEMLVWHAKHPDESLISQLLRIPEYEMPLEKIRANLKMTIGGGLNEPRDALGVAAWALLRDPGQLAAVRRDPALWHAAFEESIRWVAPIGMYSRQTTQEVSLAGVRLPAGARLGICILSANRDERVWDRAEQFDLLREVKPHLAFGKGVHVCLGAWAARAAVAEVGLPMLFDELPELRLAGEDAAEISGWVFRGMNKLAVAWNADATGTAPDQQQSEPMPRVAVVGSGPAGCFAVQALRKSFPAAPVDVFESLPTPYGLVRYGVAADHPGTKAVTRQFDRLFAEDGVRFRGNLTLGSDVALDALRENYDAVILATGMREDSPLPIPGAELARGAGAMTRYLNVHPDEATPDPLGAEVAVVGNGNVAIDVVRLLACDPSDHAGTDTADARLAHLASRVRVIHVVGRSELDAARFDPVLIREIAGMPGVTHRVHGELPTPSAGVDARVDAVRELIATGANTTDAVDRVRIEWWFGRTPASIDRSNDGSLVFRTSTAGRMEALQVDDIVTAVGFAPNMNSPVAPGAHPSGRVEPGLYTAGWLRRGPRGTIPDQRADAHNLAQLIAEDVSSGDVTVGAVGLPAQDTEVSFHGWQRIDARERAGASVARTRRKLETRDAMIEASANADFDEELRSAEEEPEEILIDGPVSVLFGSESGGAELVAEDLAALIPGAEATSLGSLLPEDLDPATFYVIVCSTYGDGEVPTDARGFHEALVQRSARLSPLRYAMFGMGDRSYDRTYSRGSELIDEALARNGARRVGEYGRHDAGGSENAGEAASEWVRGVLAELREAAMVAAG